MVRKAYVSPLRPYVRRLAPYALTYGDGPGGLKTTGAAGLRPAGGGETTGGSATDFYPTGGGLVVPHNDSQESYCESGPWNSRDESSESSSVLKPA